jgi:hypothetical protein
VPEIPELPDFSDPSFAGEGRRRPPGRPNPKPGTDSLSDLNFTRGTRIRVLKDNGKRGLVGYEGVVVHSYQGGVVVKLDNDPMLHFRSVMKTGFAANTIHPQRHFRASEVERVDPSPRAP